MSIIVQQIIQLKPCLRTLRRRWKGYYIISCWETLRTNLCELMLSALTLDPCDNSGNKSQFSKEGFIGRGGMCDCMTSQTQQQSKVTFFCVNKDTDARMQLLSPKERKSKR